eukprot:gene2171-4222_t
MFFILVSLVWLFSKIFQRNKVSEVLYKAENFFVETASLDSGLGIRFTANVHVHIEIQNSQYFRAEIDKMSDHLSKGPLPWEIKQLGEDVVDRTQGLITGLRSMELFKHGNLFKPDVLYEHGTYMHEMGADMLKIQRASTKKTSVTNTLSTNPRMKRLPRARVTVANTEKMEKQIAIDLEWDTTSWSKEEIESGCETLVAIFQNSNSTEAYEEQAIKMLGKLLQRHEVAVTFMRRNIEMLLGKAVSRRMNGNQTGGILPMLKVIHLCTPKYIKEFSIFNTVGRILEVLLMEAKLASILIQQSYRKHRHRSKPIQPGRFDEGFGTTKQIDIQVQRAINARSVELRQKWKIMHMEQNKRLRSIEYGLRGPVYMPQKYTLIMLSIIFHLISDAAGEQATGNREDAITSHGLILLANFISSTNGPFANLSVKILACIAKHPKSLYPMIHSGCVTSVMKFFLAKIKQKNGEKKHTIEIIDALNVFRYLAEHEAELLAMGSKGLIRVVYLLEEDEESLSMPSLYLLIQLCTRADCRGGLLTAKLAFMLRKSLLIDISHYNQSNYRRGMFVLVALCRKGNWNAYNPLTLPTLFQKKNDMINAIYIDMMTTLKAPTSSTAAATDNSHLNSNNTSSNNNNNRTISLDLNTLLLSSTNTEAALYLSKTVYSVGAQTLSEFLCRPNDPRHFHTLPWISAASGCSIMEAIAMDPPSAKLILSVATVRYLGHCIYLCFLELCDQQRSLSETNTNQMLRAILSSLKALTQLCHVASSSLSSLSSGHESTDIKIGIRESQALMGAIFFAMTMATQHPSLKRYPVLVQLQQDVAICAVDFLGECARLYLQMNDFDALMEMSNIVGRELTELLATLITVHGYTEYMMSVLNHVCGVLATLITHPEALDAAMNSWRIFHALHIHMPPSLGHTTTLPNVLPNTLLTHPSTLLTHPSTHPSTKSISTLATNFPIPSTTLCRTPLAALPASYFEVLGNLSVTDYGRAILLNDGYLRRTLEKIIITVGNLENESDMKEWSEMIKRREIVPKPSEARKIMTSCLHVITNCSNFTSPKIGTSNDLILNKNYKILEICILIIKSEYCPRSDVLLHNAIYTLRAISKDAIRASDEFDSIDIVTVLIKEMNRFEVICEDITQTILETIKNIALGLNGTSTSRRLYLLRDPVFRVSRLFPSLSRLVQDTLGIMSRHETPISIDSTPANAFTQLLKLSEEQNKLKVEEYKMMMEGEDGTSMGIGIGIGMGVSATEEEIHDNGHGQGRSGTYVRCGVSNCGSLISTSPSPASASGTHSSSVVKGSYSSSSSTLYSSLKRDDFFYNNTTTTPTNNINNTNSSNSNIEFQSPQLSPIIDPKILAKMRVSDGGWYCDVSGEEAKEKSLRDALMRKKFICGYSDELFPPNLNKNTRNRVFSKTAPDNSSKSLKGTESISAIEAGNSVVSSAKSLSLSLSKSPSQRSRLQTTGTVLRRRPKSIAATVTSPAAAFAVSSMRTIDVQELPELMRTRPPPR